MFSVYTLRLQVGRNTRALRILGRQLRRSELALSGEILTDVLLRLVWHFLQRRLAAARVDEKSAQRLHNLADVAASVLEALALRLPWSSYRSLLFKALADHEWASSGSLGAVEQSRNKLHVM